MQRSLKQEMFNGDMETLLPFLTSLLLLSFLFFISVFVVILGWCCWETSELIADQLSLSLSLPFSFSFFIFIFQDYCSIFSYIFAQRTCKKSTDIRIFSFTKSFGTFFLYTQGRWLFLVDWGRTWHARLNAMCPLSMPLRLCGQKIKTLDWSWKSFCRRDKFLCQKLDGVCFGPGQEWLLTWASCLFIFSSSFFICL